MQSSGSTSKETSLAMDDKKLVHPSTKKHLQDLNEDFASSFASRGRHRPEGLLPSSMPGHEEYEHLGSSEGSPSSPLTSARIYPATFQQSDSTFSMDGELQDPFLNKARASLRTPVHRRSLLNVTSPVKLQVPTSPMSANGQRKITLETSRLFEILEKKSSQQCSEEEDAEIPTLLSLYPFFNEFSLGTLEKLAGLCSCQRLSKGDVLFKQEDVEDDSLYVILNGTISLRTTDSNLNSTFSSHNSPHLEPVLPPALTRQTSRDTSRDLGESKTRQGSHSSVILNAQYGPEVGTLGAGDVIGQRVFQDRTIQNTLCSSTGIATCNGICTLRLRRRDVESAGMIRNVWSRVPYITRTNVFAGLRARLAIPPEEREKSHVDFILSSLEFMPFFMHLRDSGALPEIARNLQLECISQKTLMWHEGSTTADNRFIMQVILDGEVQHYCKGSSVDPLKIRKINWNDDARVQAILGNVKFVSTVGNVVGGPTQFGTSPDDSAVALPGTVFATIDRNDWKPALSSLNRSFSCRPQHLRRLLAAAMAEEVEVTSSDPQKDDGMHEGSGDRSLAQKLAETLRDGIQFFEQVPFGKLEELCVHFKLLKTYPREALCIAGESSRGVYIIFTGSANTHVIPADSDLTPLTHVEWGRLLAGQSPATQHHRMFLESSIDPVPYFGPKVREVFPGNIVFGGNSQQSLLAGDTPLEAIFIDTDTYVQLISPSPSDSPEMPLDTVLNTISVMRGERSITQKALIADFLSSLPELKRMDRQMLMKLSSAVSILSVDSREVVCQQGQLSNRWYGLLQGSISFHFKNSKSPEVPQTPGSNVVFQYGACFRVAFPGETFGQSSLLLKSDYIMTAVCREPCSLFVISRNEMDHEALQHAEASSRLLLRNSEYLKKPARQRTETEILSNVNFMRDNPFFSHLNDVALQKLAISVELLELTQGEQVVAGNHDEKKLMVVNKGLMSCYGSARIVQGMRYQPMRMKKSRTEDKFRQSQSQSQQDDDASNANAKGTGGEQDRMQEASANVYCEDDAHFTFSAASNLASLGGRSWNEPPLQESLMSNLMSDTNSFGNFASFVGSPMNSNHNDLASMRFGPLDTKLMKPAPDDSSPGMSLRGTLGLSTRLHFARASGFSKHVVATYGQAFWSGYPSFAEEEVEIIAFSRWHYRRYAPCHNIMLCGGLMCHELLFNVFDITLGESAVERPDPNPNDGRRRKWKGLIAEVSSGENQEVMSFLQSHPCFQGSKGAEVSSLLSQARLIHLEPFSVLFREGDQVPEVYFLKEGAVEIRTGIELGRGELSTGDRQFIPSVIVATLSTNAVVNDVEPGLGAMIPTEAIVQWSARPEVFTAVTSTRATVVALSKAQMLQGEIKDRRDRLDILERLTKSFHSRRIVEIEKARQGMILGEKVEPWHESVLRERRDLRHVLSNLQHKQFATKQPLVFSQHKIPRQATEGTSTLAAVLSPRVDCLKLPRVVNRRTFVPSHGPGTANLSRSVQASKWNSPRQPMASDPRGLPSGALRLLQEQVNAPMLERMGPTPRQLIMRHGRPPERGKPAGRSNLVGSSEAGAMVRGEAMGQLPSLSIQDLLREAKGEPQNPLQPYLKLK